LECSNAGDPAQVTHVPEKVGSRFRTGRHFHSVQAVSLRCPAAVSRRFPAGFAHGLVDAKAQREPKAALSWPFFSEPGDLGDLPASLKVAEILGFLRRKDGGVGEAYGGA
jgi:hypothetical protein